MKLNKFFMLGLVGLAFTACSNDDDAVNGGNEDGKVRITLSLGRTETTRSVGQSAAGLYNTITDLDVYFYNSAGAFVEAPETIEGNETYNKSTVIENAKNALLDILNGTSPGNVSTDLVLEGIPASASQVYIVANQNNKSHRVATTSLDAAKSTLIYLDDQVAKVSESFDDFSGEKSHMTGLGQIGTDNSVSVQLRPVPSRIELQNVTAVPVPTEKGEWGGAQIISFAVAGFYVNAFYTNGYLDPAKDDDARPQINNGSDKSKYTQEAYGSTWNIMCDEPTDGQITYATGTFNEENNPTGSLYTAIPNPRTNRWGYHILQGVVPHVVVKLNVTYNDGTTAEKFLTINKYTYANRFTEPEVEGGETHEANSEVRKVLRGHVYQINNINFDVTDLTDVPYESTKTVTATVEVLPWVGVEVIPGFN